MVAYIITYEYLPSGHEARFSQKNIIGATTEERKAEDLVDRMASTFAKNYPKAVIASEMHIDNLGQYTFEMDGARHTFEYAPLAMV